jgi:pteridine reductase
VNEDAEIAELLRDLVGGGGEPDRETHADVGDRAQVERAVARTVERFGGVHVLVNNASTFYATRFGEIETRHWDELMGSNLRGPLFLAQWAAPHLAKTQGAIVNITDIHADRPLKDYVVYTLAKAGLAALTKSLALELGPDVRVNAVAPGTIAWPEDDQFPTAERKRIVSTTPLGRIGTPADIARVVEFLASAPFVTGQTVAVDGGRDLSGAKVCRVDEKSLVEIARALCINPSFILLDEPFAGVDPIAVLDIQKIIRFLKDRGIGVLITDHNVRETLGICDRAYIINAGSVMAEGKPDEIIYNEGVRKVYLGEHFKL